jgi:ubiquinone/menaquinone biosynthesis C-methylase UbiE
MKFVDPKTHDPLETDQVGNLRPTNGSVTTVYRLDDGCYDFARHCLDSNELLHEREYYDKHYAGGDLEPLMSEAVVGEWSHWMTPWRRTLLSSLGDLSHKKILLLGNGETRREFYFAMAGADVVWTDLSLESVKQRKKQFEGSEIAAMRKGTIEFHAVEATHLPFPDDSFDIIYGAAFVHHLSATEQDTFFSEVQRCLRPNGICRFLDQAYSPMWRRLTEGVLLPLKKFSYWLNPRSPADVRADLQGGMRKEQFYDVMRKHGFREVLFEREWFFFRIVTRHYGKLVNFNPHAMAVATPLFKTVKWLDTALMDSAFMKNNGLMLIWGFTK